jgi:hypothetical protein
MKSRTRLQVVEQLIAILFIAVISALWLVPAASAQTVTIASSKGINTHIGPGDTVHAGFQVTSGGANSGAITVSVTGATGNISVGCPDGSTQTITINFPATSVPVPAKNNAWFPADNNTYQGTAIAPSNLCGGKGGLDKGAVFNINHGERCDNNNNDNNNNNNNMSKKHGEGGGCCEPVCFRVHRERDHEGDHSGGEWDDDEHSCKKEKHCSTAEEKDDCSCHDHEHDHH